LFSLDQITSLGNLSLIIHDSRSTFQGIWAKSTSIYLTSEALYLDSAHDDLSLSREMAIIKTLLDTRAVRRTKVTIMIPEAPDMAAVPIIRTLYPGFFDGNEMEVWSNPSEEQISQVQE
jgi:hypothetical protein